MKGSPEPGWWQRAGAGRGDVFISLLSCIYLPPSPRVTWARGFEGWRGAGCQARGRALRGQERGEDPWPGCGGGVPLSWCPAAGARIRPRQRRCPYKGREQQKIAVSEHFLPPFRPWLRPRRTWPCCSRARKGHGSPLTPALPFLLPALSPVPQDLAARSPAPGLTCPGDQHRAPPCSQAAPYIAL